MASKARACVNQIPAIGLKIASARTRRDTHEPRRSDAIKYEYLNSTNEVLSTIEKEQPKMDLNQILFGPPGTGKTYNTINEALAILDPALLDQHKEDLVENRKVLTERFKDLLESKRIRFVTFHQSFSYEDFVEGLSAKAEDGKLSYSVKSGVFKELCRQALGGVAPENDVFEQAKIRFIEEVSEQEDPFVLKTKNGKEFYIVLDGGKNEFHVMPKNSAENASPIRKTWSFTKSMYMGLEPKGYQSYIPIILKYLKDSCGLVEYEKQVIGEKHNFVLIIDEINRGSISRIFGELITLIEPSKRAGADEQLEVILPYSKERFTIPDNVYIIGTMNTSDRSLAGLDIALRRRFTFKEMPPRPDLLDGLNVDGINIGAMLRVMNERITVLLGRDHCLGHAYFMPLKKEPTLANLKAIFSHKIIPLLQEYFFEDWRRIGWVLNDHRKPKINKFVCKDASLNVVGLFGDIPDLRNENPCWKFNTEALDLKESYLAIYSNIDTIQIAQTVSSASEADE